MMHKRYRIVSTPRFITFLVICALLIIYATVSFSGMYNAEGLTQESFEKVQITSGDTLWNIAEEYSATDTDVRRMVYDICELNEISADQIHEGDVILIPVNSRVQEKATDL